VYFQNAVLPPSSPPNTQRLIMSTMMQVMDVHKNNITENDKPSVFTLKVPPFIMWYIEPISHGIPNPKNIFTLFDPVTLPIALSAYLLCMAACLLANVSGNDVPRATKVIAVAEFLRPMTHPNKVATSPTIAVTRPINIREKPNDNQPLQYLAGGINENSSFQPMVKKCINASIPDTSIILLSSSI
jgi:hypothetical protein